MTSAANTLLSLILIALGFIGITLSFLVPDRKKSTISLILAGVIIVLGVSQWGIQSFERMRMERRMREFQRTNQVNLDELREKLKTQSTQSAAGNGAAKK